MVANLVAYDDQSYPECPTCGSVRSRIVPVADPPPNIFYLYCDACYHAWPVPAPNRSSSGGSNALLAT
jgi:hypothetical protein